MRGVLWELLATLIIATIVLTTVALLGIVAVGLPVILASAFLIRRARPPGTGESLVLTQARAVAAEAWASPTGPNLVAAKDVPSLTAPDS